MRCRFLKLVFALVLFSLFTSVACAEMGSPKGRLYLFCTLSPQANLNEEKICREDRCDKEFSFETKKECKTLEAGEYELRKNSDITHCNTPNGTIFYKPEDFFYEFMDLLGGLGTPFQIDYTWMEVRRSPIGPVDDRYNTFYENRLNLAKKNCEEDVYNIENIITKKAHWWRNFILPDDIENGHGVNGIFIIAPNTKENERLIKENILSAPENTSPFLHYSARGDWIFAYTVNSFLKAHFEYLILGIGSAIFLLVFIAVKLKKRLTKKRR